MTSMNIWKDWYKEENLPWNKPSMPGMEHYHFTEDGFRARYTLYSLPSYKGEEPEAKPGNEMFHNYRDEHIKPGINWDNLVEVMNALKNPSDPLITERLTAGTLKIYDKYERIWVQYTPDDAAYSLGYEHGQRDAMINVVCPESDERIYLAGYEDGYGDVHLDKLDEISS